MKITWTFYPKNQPSICLELIYDYRLDALKLDCGGVIDRVRNIAVVDWKTFSIFNKGENNEKKPPLPDWPMLQISTMPELIRIGC